MQHGYVQHFLLQIVASYLQKVYIFEPAPLVHHESTHVSKLFLHTYFVSFKLFCVRALTILQTSIVNIECFVISFLSSVKNL